MIITDEIHVYLGIILYKNKPNKAYSVIPFVFQILALLFYFEILEFNFCGLNKNTAKNIKNRERIEFERKSMDSSRIELGGQYIFKNDTILGDDYTGSRTLSNNFLPKINSINDDGD